MEIGNSAGKKYVETPNDLARKVPNQAEAGKEKNISPAGNVVQNPVIQKSQDTVELTIPTHNNQSKAVNTGTTDKPQAQNTEIQQRDQLTRNVSEEFAAARAEAAKKQAARDAAQTAEVSANIQEKKVSEVTRNATQINAQRREDTQIQENQEDTNPRPQGVVDFLA